MTDLQPQVDSSWGWPARAFHALRSVRAAQAILVVVTAFLAIGFAFRQELWVDEASQLSGLTLQPVEMLRWLAGHEWGRFGVPGDRSPPGSYVAGWIWSRTFGLSEISLRI